MKKGLKQAAAWVLCGALFWGQGLAVEEPPAGQETGLTGISAPCAILMDEDGQVLFERNADQPREPASVTKVMTMLLVMEALESGKISLDETVTASARAAGQGGSQIYLKENEQMTVEEMLKSVAVASANDCAVALAEHLAGSEEAFVAQMNQRAAELGMSNTHFVNCNGLPAPGHVSTARDIALMSRQLIRHKDIFNYTTIWMDSVRDGAFGLTNTNRLIRTYDGMTGLKTGYTKTAGYCLSATAERQGLSLVAVALGAPDIPTRSADIAALLNYGFANYQKVTVTPDQPIMPLPVRLGKQDYALCELEGSPELVIEKSKVSSLEKELEMEEFLTAPVEKGRQAGLLRVTAGGETLAEIPVVVSGGVDRLSLWGLAERMLSACAMRRAPAA